MRRICHVTFSWYNPYTSPPEPWPRVVLDEEDALQNFFEYTAGVTKDDILEVRYAYTVSYAIGDELASDSIVATTRGGGAEKVFGSTPDRKTRKCSCCCALAANAMSEKRSES